LPELNLFRTVKQLSVKNSGAFLVLISLPIVAAWLSLCVGVGAQEKGEWWDASAWFEGSPVFNSELDQVSGKPRSFFSQRLVIRNLDTTQEDVKQKQVNFRGRNFVEADFSNSTLPGADFTASNLSHANLSASNLLFAIFGCADNSFISTSVLNQNNGDWIEKIEDDVHKCTDLSSANLISSNLSFADLGFANLSGAKLEKSKLYFTRFERANLLGANLRESAIFPFPENANLTLIDLRDATIGLASKAFFDYGRPVESSWGIANRGADLRRSSIGLYNEPDFGDDRGNSEDIESSQSLDIRSANFLDKQEITSFVQGDLDEMRTNIDEKNSSIFEETTKLISVENFLHSSFEEKLKSAATRQSKRWDAVENRMARAAWSADKVCSSPAALEAVVDRYFDMELPTKPTDSIMSGFFSTEAKAWDSSGGGQGCGCGGDRKGSPNFDSKSFAQRVLKCPAFVKVPEQTREKIILWAKRKYIGH
jgi:uncharacterized protein YjbI with pentapeptide repeats